MRLNSLRLFSQSCGLELGRFFGLRVRVWVKVRVRETWFWIRVMNRGFYEVEHSILRRTDRREKDKGIIYFMYG